MITISSLIMVIPAMVIHNIIPFDYSSRLIDLVIMMVLGIMMLIIYYLTTKNLQLPQQIFDLEDVSIRSLISRLRR